MNWLIFALFAFVLLALEIGLAPLLAVGDGIAPSFVLILAAYIGLLAPAALVPWALLILGLAVDLQPDPVPEATVLGPLALGYLAGALVVLQLRSLVFRESIISLAAMIFAMGIFVHLVAVALLTARGLGFVTNEPIPGFSASQQLVQRFLELVYTAALAVPVGYLLFKSTSLWQFAHGGKRG